MSFYEYLSLLKKSGVSGFCSKESYSESKINLKNKKNKKIVREKS